eukprot:TRINITY_DN15022_c0_g1_i1.p1 TRINITY_DN15022_c0_g1~~TRINITY_DN15022_c0_g1_i1.p1  ORF type:complete len:228 (-),score=27.84 TRINITY_DN15022_c0_g1_i1:199-882(-)
MSLDAVCRLARRLGDCQRFGIIISDLMLIGFAVDALQKDWHHSCDKGQHVYGILCIIFAMLDMFLELPRCSLKRHRRQLNSVNQGQAGPSPWDSLDTSVLAEKGLLAQRKETSGVGHPCEEWSLPESLQLGRLDAAVVAERVVVRKVSADLQYWVNAFCSFASVIYCSLSLRHKECDLKVFYLQRCVQIFTIIYIFRFSTHTARIVLDNFQDGQPVAGMTAAKAGLS